MSKKQTRLEIFDDPTSQIRFLELSLGAKEWRASIYIPPEHGDASKIVAKLKAHGVRVKQSMDEDGFVTLHIHHLGPAPDVRALFREYGLIAGGGHVIHNPLLSSKQLIQGMAGSIRDLTQSLKEPARANGLTYVTAEAFLFAAAGGNPHGKWYTPKNLLQGISASFFLSQSLAYLGWAKKGDDRIISDLDQQLSAEHGFEGLGDVPALNERASPGLLGHARRALEDHPIQSGAMLNNLGMMTYIAHAVLERRHRQGLLKLNPNDHKALQYINKDFWWGVGGSLVSMAGWSSLLVTPKEIEEKSNNPLMRLYENWRENPQTTATLTTLISSGSRLKEAIGKGNKLQAIGEGIYIPGDIMLFFIKNNEYGASTTQSLQLVADKVAPILLAKPMLVSPQQQNELYAHTADYLLNQIEALSGKKLTNGELEENKATLIEALKTNCTKQLGANFNQMGLAAGQLVALFPESQEEATERLATALSHVPSLYANKEELLQCICAPGHMHREPAMPQNLDQLSGPIGALVETIPTANEGNIALAIAEALGPLLRANPAQPLAAIDAHSAVLKAPAEGRESQQSVRAG